MKISFSQYGIKNIATLSEVTLEETFKLITDCEPLQNSTEELRSLEGKEQDDYKINKLPYVTFGGTFNERKDAGLIKESGLVCIDIDSLQDVAATKQVLRKSSLPVLYFVSPKGNGLKVVFVCNKKYSFKENYVAYSRYLIEKVGIAEKHIDKSCSNISRACFLCHDADAFFDHNRLSGQVLEFDPVLGDIYFMTVTKPVTEADMEEEEAQASVDPLFLHPSFSYQPIKLDYKKRNGELNFITLCRIASRDANEFKVGNRHNWLLKLASICVHFGMTKEYALKHFKTLFSDHPAVVDMVHPFDEKNDLIRVFDDVYENKAEQFATWTDKNEEWQTPFIPNSVYEALPKYMKDMAGLFPSPREKDMFFLGLLVLLSACFPRVYGIYDRRRYQSNLFMFISAPAGSGKGVLTFVRMLGETIQKELLDEYKTELAEFNSLQDEEDEKDNVEIIKPVLKKFFIPADNTSAKLKQSIGDNGTLGGIVFDTEADTLSSANKSKHGEFSHLYRKAFQHEPIEYERKGNNEYLSIERPALSVLLSGTPHQIRSLVKDVENGLTSRFAFYYFNEVSGWKDVFVESTDLGAIFRSEGGSLASMTAPYLLKYIKEPQSEIQFLLTGSQAEKLNTVFDQRCEQIVKACGNEIGAAVYRMGLIQFRIAMILTIMRKIEKAQLPNELPPKIYCEDVDFNIANSIVECLLHHMTAVFFQMKGSRRSTGYNMKQQYYDSLPSEFNRQDAMDIASLFQIPEKTAESYLRQGTTAGVLNKPKHNHYVKA